MHISRVNASLHSLCARVRTGDAGNVEQTGGGILGAAAKEASKRIYSLKGPQEEEGSAGGDESQVVQRYPSDNCTGLCQTLCARRQKNSLSGLRTTVRATPPPRSCNYATAYSMLTFKLFIIKC